MTNVTETRTTKMEKKKTKVTEKSLKNLKSFSSTHQPAKNGRKKKIYTVLKEKGYGKGDIVTAFGEMAFYTLEELKEVHQDESKPIITRIVAKQFYSAYASSDWTKIREIMEYAIGGKPSQDLFVGDISEKKDIEVTYTDMNGDD